MKSNLHIALHIFLHSSVALSLACAATGCGPRGPATYPVSGSVTLGGVPLAEGDITLRDVEERLPPVQGKIIDGRYELRATPGEKRVEIIAHKITGERFDEMMQAKVEIREQIVPEKYNTQSELRIQVSEGETPHDFNLEAKP